MGSWTMAACLYLVAAVGAMRNTRIDETTPDQVALLSLRVKADSKKHTSKVKSKVSSVEHLHKILKMHLANTPFQPGVVPGSLSQHFAKVDPSHAENESDILVKPDWETVNTSLPWESGKEPLARCSSEQGPERDADSADAHLQKATSIFCEAGLGSMVEFYVDPRFESNYEKLKGSDGWIPKAYVTYMGLRGTGDNKIGAEEDLLVQSVHHFSKYPVVLANFGAPTWRVPKHMTPERFPNLVLMHARTSATTIHKGFNLNKLVTMMFTKVKGGLVLDADQWVNHGVDVMVERAFEETTKDYPYIVMPVHFMSRDPESDDMMERYPKDYAFHFKDPNGPNRTMRWGHSHPTWTHYALPWLAKWTSYVLAPEKTGAPTWLTKQGFVSDEPLMNFALWADGLTKQWCKYDLPGPKDFGTYISQAERKHICSDSKFFPKGIAYVFFTAHAAKDLEKSYDWLSKLWDLGDDKRKAILFDGKWFGSGKALRAYDPSLRCIA